MKILHKTLTIVFIISLTVFAQAPYAPWAKLSTNAPKDISSRKYPVPTKDEVGIARYPGSVISSVSAPKEDTLQYAQEILPFVILVSTDNPSSVISFYKRILTKDKGWTYSEEYRTFVKGSTGKALTGFVPSVAIRDENGNNFDLGYVDQTLKSKLKTRIQITYKPAK